MSIFRKKRHSYDLSATEEPSVDQEAKAKKQENSRIKRSSFKYFFQGSVPKEKARNSRQSITEIPDDDDDAKQKCKENQDKKDSAEKPEKPVEWEMCTTGQNNSDEVINEEQDNNNVVKEEEEVNISDYSLMDEVQDEILKSPNHDLSKDKSIKFDFPADEQNKSVEATTSEVVTKKISDV